MSFSAISNYCVILAEKQADGFLQFLTWLFFVLFGWGGIENFSSLHILTMSTDQPRHVRRSAVEVQGQN